MVYLAGVTHALNDVSHGAERERLGVLVFKLAKDHWSLLNFYSRDSQSTIPYFGIDMLETGRPTTAIEACAVTGAR
jgi:hypothetical protein